MKTCTNKHCACKQPQPLTSFQNNKHNPDGKQDWCRTCINRRMREVKERARELKKAATYNQLRQAEDCAS